MSGTARTATDWQLRKRVDRERAEHVKVHGPGCQICGTVPKSRGLAWDHDHKTGATRGWLCHRCNRNLPTWVDAEWCLKAFEYLGGDIEQFYMLVDGGW